MTLQDPDDLRIPYQGFEQGPIRPPSEAGSLLLRVTRNCPWNRCKFCPVYKDQRFSIRPVEHVKKDLDAIYHAVQEIGGRADEGRAKAPAAGDLRAWQAAWNWVRNGMGQVFLQDANSLVINPADLLEILRHLKYRFPGVKRVTSYARSSTMAHIPDESLAALREAGLNRIHIGLESGADEVLRRVHKGTTKKQQIRAGLKVKKAGMELSEYYMPGLGGRDLLEVHALETAAALNEINPDFIRIRTLAIPGNAPLYDDYRAGRFAKCTDSMMVQELGIFLESLTGITSIIRSDHILNLLPGVEGTLPRDQGRMLRVIRNFLDLDPERRCLYQVGRRTGIMSGLGDLEDPGNRAQVLEICRQSRINPDKVDSWTDELMRRFI